MRKHPNIILKTQKKFCGFDFKTIVEPGHPVHMFLYYKSSHSSFQIWVNTYLIVPSLLKNASGKPII